MRYPPSTMVNEDAGAALAVSIEIESVPYLNPNENLIGNLAWTPLSDKQFENDLRHAEYLSRVRKEIHSHPLKLSEQ
jgi:hypothetical protein